MESLLFLILLSFAFLKDPRCHFTCETCSSSHSYTTCTSCSSSAKLFNGSCVCPSGMGMTPEGECQPCDPSCAECTIAGLSTHCTLCKDPSTTLTDVPILCIMIFPPPPHCDYFGVKAGACVCPEGYAIGKEGICADCHSTCKSCSVPDNKHFCISCNAGTLHRDNYCEDLIREKCSGLPCEEIPDVCNRRLIPGIYGVCTECHETCKTCNKETRACLECYENAYLSEDNKDDKCYCNKGYHFNSKLQVCYPN